MSWIENESNSAHFMVNQKFGKSAQPPQVGGSSELITNPHKKIIYVFIFKYLNI